MMNEVRFIKNNGSRWKEFETFLSSGKKINPDILSRYYIELTDDLAFSKTFFPNSKTTKYLNQLTLKAHTHVFKRRKTSRNALIRFFAIDYPLVVYSNRKNIFYAFLIFIISAIVGIISLQSDSSYVVSVLGEDYVATTLENIEKGEPMAIYESRPSLPMFFYIAWNNIRVSFMAFSMGVLAGFGTFYIMFFNGLMVGTFQYFFFTKGLLVESGMAIWLHGTVEITSIIFAGGAGIRLGRSILFPGTFPRIVSIRNGGSDGAKMVAGLIPLFLIAAFIESYLTRNYDKSYTFDLMVIGVSILFILAYFFIYPYLLTKKQNYAKQRENDAL